MYTFAKLDKDQVSAIENFENEQGMRLLALKDVSLSPASVDAEKLDSIKQLEEKLGICLLAVQ